MSLILVKPTSKAMLLESFVDGEGVRLTLFLAGCPHQCKGCHNPSTWNQKNGERVAISVLVDQLIPYLKNGHLDGLTLSGGDPAWQSEGVVALLKALRKEIPSLNVWLYTGFYVEQLSDGLLELLDVVVDGPFESDKRYPAKPFRGSHNQRLIRLAKGQIESVE